MFYRRVNINQPITQLTVPNLFDAMQQFETPLDFTGIINSYQQAVPTITKGADITSGKTAVTIPEVATPTHPVLAQIHDNEYCFMSPHLTSCAAVIFYCDSEVFVYHAAGGVIDQNITNPIIQNHNVNQVIYATPNIPFMPGNLYQISVDYLTNSLGTANVGMIDGFNQNVFADGNGNIQFI